jgi:hypothetical protein
MENASRTHLILIPSYKKEQGDAPLVHPYSRVPTGSEHAL